MYVILFMKMTSNQVNILLKVYMLNTGEGRIQHTAEMVRQSMRRNLDRNGKAGSANKMKIANENYYVWCIRESLAECVPMWDHQNKQKRLGTWPLNTFHSPYLSYFYWFSFHWLLLALTLSESTQSTGEILSPLYQYSCLERFFCMYFVQFVHCILQVPLEQLSFIQYTAFDIFWRNEK